MSIPKTRHEVRKSDMSILINPNVTFEYAGLFQSDGDWIHPRRNERTYEIIYVTGGEVYLREGDTDLALRQGELAILLPNTWHEGTRITKNVSFFWVHFSLNGELPFNIRHIENFHNAYLFKELLHYNNLPTVPADLVGALLLHILCEVKRIATENTSAYDRQAEKIYEWIRINADASLSATRIAEHFGYSADHVSRICKKHFSQGAKSLINKFLLAKAKSLLSNTDKYIKEISAELKFSSDKTFISYFKYHEGCFPKEYRDRFSRLHMNNR